MLLLGIIWLLSGVLLVIVAGIVPARTSLSRFELERRAKLGDKKAATILSREAKLDDIVSLGRIVSALLLVIFVALSVSVTGWVIGILISLFVALEYGAIARLPFIRNQSQKIYLRYESKLLQYIENFSAVFAWLRTVAPEQPSDLVLDSREHLQHLIDSSHAILTPDEKRFISQSLVFEKRLVSEIMTPRSVIDTIGSKELLGPLVLSDLHKTGHSRFPVIDTDIDHVVGMLYIQDLLTLDSGKSSTTAAKAMDSRVFYIRQDQTLGHALAAFLRTHHHLFVVVNEYRETVGLLSLEDVMEALLGRKINDEFDSHEDLRVVALRQAHTNNSPGNSINI